MIDPEILIETFSLDNAVVRGENLMASCPFAELYHDSGSDKHPSFGINLETQHWNCYVCGEVGGKGNTLQDLAKKLEVTLPVNLVEIRKKPKRVNPKNKEVYEDYLKEIYSNNPEIAYERLKDRGVSLNAIEELGVGGHSVLDEIYFPDIDIDGTLRGVTARSESFDSRYKFELGNKQQALFGMDKPYDEVFLVEGPVDALKLKSWGFNGVATLGDRITQKKAERILPSASNIYLVPDNDEAGNRWEKQAFKFFGNRVKLFLIRVTNFEDVGNKDYKEDMFLNDYRNKIMIVKKRYKKKRYKKERRK